MQETQETRVQSLGQEDPLKEELATHSSILVWKIPWTKEPGQVTAHGGNKESDTTERARTRARTHTRACTHTHAYMERIRQSSQWLVKYWSLSSSQGITWLFSTFLANKIYTNPKL